MMVLGCGFIPFDPPVHTPVIREVSPEEEFTNGLYLLRGITFKQEREGAIASVRRVD